MSSHIYKEGGGFIDLNNLITTIISATAALVAIIGGFLVSRVITLSSEKNAIVRRLREIDSELSNKQEMLHRIELILLEDDIDDFINDHAEDILIYGKSVQDVLEEDNSSGLTVEELGPYIIKLHEIFEHVTTLIEQTEENYSIPNNFDDFAKDNAIKVDEHKDWYDLVYRTLWDAIPAKPSSNPFWGVNLQPMLSTTSLMKSVSPVTAQIHQDRIKERNSLENEVQILAGMKEEQLKILSSYGNISGLWGGLAVLIYACISGIVIPSLLLPYPLETYDDVATRKLLLTLFFSQLIALFVYLGVSMYKLTKED